MHGVGERFGIVTVVGDVQGRDGSMPSDPGKHTVNLGTRLVVERREWFVEEQDRGPKGEGAAQGGSLAFAPAEARRDAIQQVAESEEFREFLDAGVDGA